MSNFALTAPCTCSITAYDETTGYRYELKPCSLHGAAQELLEACQAALYACSCTVRERESGHRIDCCIPLSLEPAIRKAEGR